MQIKEMKADLSQISYLQDVKSNLKKLALNRANVPAEAMDAIDAITEKLQDILPPLATEKANDVENANQVIGQFTTAGSIYSGAIAANNDVSNGTQSNAVSKNEASAAHIACRAAESEDWGLHDACAAQQDGLQTIFNGKISDVENAATAAEPTTCDPSTDDIYGFVQHNVNAVNTYHDAIDALITAKGNLGDKTGECNGLSDDLTNQRGLCDTDQTTFEVAACTWATAYVTAASNYNTAYGIASTTYDESLVRWNDNSDNRVAQCQLIFKITCYVNALKDYNEQEDLEAAIESCDSADPEAEGCAPYSFEAPGKPDQDAIVDTPATHCDAGFDYGTLPANTQLGEASPCCSA